MCQWETLDIESQYPDKMESGEHEAKRLWRRFDDPKVSAIQATFDGVDSTGSRE